MKNIVYIISKGDYIMKLSITNLSDFSKILREEAAKSISETYTEDLNDFITLSQVQQIIIKNSIGKDTDGCYIITENIFDNTFEEVRNRIYQTGLCKLAASGIIECAWDDKKNEMVFWMNSEKKGIIDISSHSQY